MQLRSTADGSSPSFAVVIPMYDEESNAERCVLAVVEELRHFPQPAALVVVDDGSQDRTQEILRQLVLRIPELIMVSHRGNQGYGRATASGIAKARELGFDYALFMDSDLTNPPGLIGAFVEQMERGTDVIKASRYVPGGGMKGVPFHRVATSVIGNRLVTMLMGLPLRDCTNGFRAVRVDLLSRIPLREPGFAVIMDELYHLKFLARTYAEVPYTLVSREVGRGRSKFRYRPKVFWQYLRYPLMAALGIRPAVVPIQTRSGD